MANRINGAEVLVAYVGEEGQWHSRLVLSHVVDETYVILTPDLDVYC